MNSRAKGCRIEREAAKYLTSLGFPAERAARNGKRGANDIECPSLANVHIEVKGSQKIDLGTKALADAIIQAQNDTEPLVERWAVLWKKNGTCWRLTYEGYMGAMVTVAGDVDIRSTLRAMGEEK
jgi:Holliday junction resolvase